MAPSAGVPALAFGPGGLADLGGAMLAAPAHCVLGKDSIKIDMEIKLPRMEEKAEVKKVTVPVKKNPPSQLSEVFEERRLPEPVYFQSFDCVGVPSFLTLRECRRIIDFGEAQGFSLQRRHRMLNLLWTDIVDSSFAAAMWHKCGLEWFMRNITLDGLVACGLNDVIRIHKYVPGSCFGRHIDQHVERADGRVSKYSLRVFLNGQDEGEFEGGYSAFHVAFRPEPIVFEPEMGLALLYPQGELCTVQEESEVTAGCKYVLRADVLFQRPKTEARR